MNRFHWVQMPLLKDVYRETRALSAYGWSPALAFAITDKSGWRMWYALLEREP